ncbi:MAG: methyltransferase domain-containing protein, partial [Psychrosphaera sp.]|nr:methyltransferase domain-containing protein [Psychrosphaera sp.]
MPLLLTLQVENSDALKAGTKAALEPAHGPESAFGKWFLRTGVWTHRVLEIALQDLCQLMSHKTSTQNPQFDVIVDVACGYGESLAKLNSRVSPKKRIAMDIDPEMLDEAAKNFRYEDCKSEYWNPEEFSLLHGTPLWEQADQGQRV